MEKTNQQTTGQIVTCGSCGASFDASLPACPYCGTMYLPGAKKDYMGKLSGIRDDLGALPKGMKPALRKEMSSQGKRILRIFIILAILIAAVLAIMAVRKKREAEAFRKEYAWESEHFPEWDRLYENGEYDSLTEEIRAASDGDHEVYNWKHYEFYNALENLNYLANTVEAVRGGDPSVEEAELLYCVLNAEGFPERQELSEKDRSFLTERASPLLAEAEELLDIDVSLREDLTAQMKKQGGHVYYSQCEEALKKKGGSS